MSPLMPEKQSRHTTRLKEIPPYGNQGAVVAGF